MSQERCGNKAQVGRQLMQAHDPAPEGLDDQGSQAGHGRRKIKTCSQTQKNHACLHPQHSLCQRQPDQGNTCCQACTGYHAAVGNVSRDEAGAQKRDRIAAGHQEKQPGCLGMGEFEVSFNIQEQWAQNDPAQKIAIKQTGYDDYRKCGGSQAVIACLAEPDRGL